MLPALLFLLPFFLQEPPGSGFSRDHKTRPGECGGSRPRRPAGRGSQERRFHDLGKRQAADDYRLQRGVARQASGQSGQTATAHLLQSTVVAQWRAVECHGDPAGCLEHQVGRSNLRAQGGNRFSVASAAHRSHRHLPVGTPLMTDRVLNTLQALEMIANHLASVQGRKNLIWVSDGFPLGIGFNEIPSIGSRMGSGINQRLFTPEMDHAIRAPNDAGVAVYPVDASGLRTDPFRCRTGKRDTDSPKAN